MSDSTAQLGFLPMGQPNRFDVYLHIDITQTAPASDPRIAEIIGALSRIEGKVDKMANLDEVIAAVSAQSTKLDSVIVLIAGLKGQLSDFLSGILTPDNQAKVDAIMDAASTNAAKIADALDENVPPPAAAKKK